MKNLTKVVLGIVMEIIIVSFLLQLFKVLGNLLILLLVCTYCHQKGYFRLKQA